MRATSSLSRSTAVQPCREDCRQRILSGTVVPQHPRHGAVRPPWSATLSIFGCPQNRGELQFYFFVGMAILGAVAFLFRQYPQTLVTCGRKAG